METPKILIPALRQYQHNHGGGLVAAFEYKETVKTVTTLEQSNKALVDALDKILKSQKYCTMETPLIDAVENLQRWIREIKGIATKAIKSAESLKGE